MLVVLVSRVNRFGQKRVRGLAQHKIFDKRFEDTY